VTDKLRHLVCSRCGQDNKHLSWVFDGNTWEHECTIPEEPPRLIIGEQEWAEDDPTPTTVVAAKVPGEE